MFAGVDVGGTKTSIVVVDDRDRVLYEQVAPTDASSLVGQIAGLVDDARRELGQDVAAVGVAIPGHVDPEDGSVSMAVNLGISHLPLGSMLQTALGIPTFIEHDARAAVLWLSGHAADGSAQAPASVAFLAIGTGISAGIVLDGAAAPRRQRPCRRGRPSSSPIRMGPSARAGCAAASRRSPPVRPSPARPTRRWRPVAARSCRPIRAPQTSSAPAAAGDEVAVEIVDRVADHLARAIRSLALTLGVERVVIGGGVAAAGPALLDPIRSRIARDRAASPLVQAALGDATVELLSPNEAPGARGAAAIARHRIGLPEREGVGAR